MDLLIKIGIVCGAVWLLMNVAYIALGLIAIVQQYKLEKEIDDFVRERHEKTK